MISRLPFALFSLNLDLLQESVLADMKYSPKRTTVPKGTPGSNGSLIEFS